jgi:hypothetical protein
MGQPPIHACKVYPSNGLNGFYILIPRVPTDMARIVANFTRYSGSVTLSKRRGA